MRGRGQTPLSRRLDISPRIRGELSQFSKNKIVLNKINLWSNVDLSTNEYIKEVLPFINLNIDPSSRTFTISGITASKNTIVMKSSNGLFSDTSQPSTFIMVSLDRATYVDPADNV